MASAISLRTWATPLTVGAFFLMAGTGVLMFFELDDGLVTVVHQWLSWLFLAGVAGHITANFRPFKHHLKSSWGRASVALFGVVLIVSFFSWGLTTGPQLERPIEEALIDAPLSALADVTHTSADELVRRMKKHGVSAKGQQSIRDLSSESGESENRLLAIVFLPGK